MANLTVKQKNDIKELKSLISKSVFTVAKIQDTTIVEQELLQQAMDYIAIDRVGDYHGRMNELNKYRYMIDGISSSGTLHLISTMSSLEDNTST